MKRSLILIASLSSSIIVQVATPAAQNVGGELWEIAAPTAWNAA